MTAQVLEIVLMLGLFGGGALAGAFTWRAPASGWLALALAALLPALGIILTRVFC